ncbi:MAG: hypothetical protein KF800_10800 [Lysobacter sp.]|nr:hypothetical protein [Lysobacter sp.]
MRSRAEARVARWVQVFEHMANGTADYGSRTPFADVPAWATLEVATGGFATGRLLAGGALTESERQLAEALGLRAGQERLDLNLWYLSDAGIAQLQSLLCCGHYRIDLPEEAALPMVAWLLGQGRTEQAWDIIEAIAPFFDKLRFFPARERAPSATADVHVFSVGEVRERLANLADQPRVAVQKRTIEVRLPLYDEAIALFLQTCVDGWPCRHYPEGWTTAARTLAERIRNSGEPGPDAMGRFKDRVAELFAMLSACARDPASLDSVHARRIRTILDDFVRAHGEPGSERHRALRDRQRQDVAAPLYSKVGSAVAARLASKPAAEGIADFSDVSVPVTQEEAGVFGLQAGQSLPGPILARLHRCRQGTIAELIEHGIITSSDTIARVLPALTAQIGSAELTDPALRRLYAAAYRAFRRRRSLLLLNLQSQVRITELPWVAAVEGDRVASVATVEAARAALVESASVALVSFPHAVTPNKLVKEFRALGKTAGLNLPFVDEIAADIFMGEFTNTFIDAARRSARTIAGTLYARYYDIDTDVLASLPDRPKSAGRRSWWNRGSDAGDALSALAAHRAGTTLGGWGPANNGTILEQCQILTTHNLAVLFDDLELRAVLSPVLDGMAIRCFEWICRRQQIRIDNWHARLVMVKNTAYAWRQMMFFLSMMDEALRNSTIDAIEAHFQKQTDAFRSRFEPVIRGLHRAASGQRLVLREPSPEGARVFLGWTTGRHWLLS